jgi:hypothetical protein
MSPQRQEELTELLEQVLNLPPVVTMKPEARLKRVHYDWLAAGEHTQRTVALLSQQLRRFLDDQAWLENRRIMEILHSIETIALSIRESAPDGPFMEIADTAADIELPMERPLFSPPHKPVIADTELLVGNDILDMAALYTLTVIDKWELAANIRQALQTRSQVSLPELLVEYPLQHGLAELIAYVQLASESSRAVITDRESDLVEWQAENGAFRRARLPKIIFARETA